jgi:signal peptidase I
VGALRRGLGILSWVGAVLIVIALVLKVLVFDVAEVGHNGMAPTLLRGERVLIHKRGRPELGAIVVCQHPTEVGWVVGRVAALEGMAIDSSGHELRIDETPVVFDEEGRGPFHNADNGLTATVVWGTERLGATSYRIFAMQNGSQQVSKTTVPAGRVFLLGDYRAYMGQDSRAYGVVDASTCRGNIVFRLTPVDGLDPEIAHGYFETIR